MLSLSFLIYSVAANTCMFIFCISLHCTLEESELPAGPWVTFWSNRTSIDTWGLGEQRKPHTPSHAFCKQISDSTAIGWNNSDGLQNQVFPSHTQRSTQFSCCSCSHRLAASAVQGEGNCQGRGQPSPTLLPMPWYPHPVPQSRKDKTGCKAKTADLQLLRLKCPCFPLPMPALSLPTSPERVTQAGKMHSVHQAWQSSNYQVSMKSPPLNGLKLDSVKTPPSVRPLAIHIC